MTNPIPTGWTLALHGGAGGLTRDSIDAVSDAGARAGLQRALDAGSAVLRAGGAALDAVIAAVVQLEDDPHFNAGHGAVYTADATHELDAAVMEGTGRRAGAVAGLTRVRNPVRLARTVMDESPHAFLAGAGAERFAADHGAVLVDPAYFGTPARLAQLEAMKARGNGFDARVKFGTVGAVARDAGGHLAAATSTGGLTGKRWGRIGNSPVIGAGTYADDRAVAVSATGSGEVFLRACAAHEIAARVRLAGESPAVAAAAVMADIGALGGEGGVIVVGREGPGLFTMNAPGMYRARADADGLCQVAIYGDE